MRVFLTGATGFIGSAVIPELLAAGHTVIGATRSEAGAEKLRAAGVTPFHGTLEEPEGLGRGAAEADGVIHCAFDHNFAAFAENCEKDRRVIRALAAALAGTDRPLLITSGVGMGDAGDGRPASEDVYKADHPLPRVASEQAGAEALAAGINVVVVRLPQVHDTARQGLITYGVALAREKGVSAYVGEGRNRWAAGHISDAARLYRLALEKAQPGARYHAVGEEGVSFRDIAEAIGRVLKVPAVSVKPEETEAHFGWLAHFAGVDLTASSVLTQARLGWRPTGPDLLTDLGNLRLA